MASIFRTVKHEDLKDFNKWREEEREKTKLRKDKDAEMLKIDDEMDYGEGTKPDDEEDDDSQQAENMASGKINKGSINKTEDV